MEDLAIIKEKSNDSFETENDDRNLFSSFEIDISVRQLVEFVLRSGDIDNRRIGSDDSSMQEGSRIHRMIQGRMGENYSSEVLLRYRYSCDNYIINIEGRADGIIYEEVKQPDKELNQLLLNDNFAVITIDEIKTTNKNLEKIKEPVLVHLAQAKVYAYIYLIQNNLEHIRVRMTYCNRETEEIKYFHQEYSKEEISAWFDEIINSYKKWADFQYNWNCKRQKSIKELEFPFQYRDGQRELAVNVYGTIARSKKLFIEAPTGVGKTLSTIFPTVKSMGEGLTEKIFYLTAKTITRTVAEDTFSLLRSKNLSIKTVAITAKDKICPLDERECNPSHCPYARGHFDRVNDAIYEAITGADDINRGLIESIALKHNVCPFEMSLDISNFADAVICDYNYVFDPHACLKRFFTDGMRGNYTFLIDEAHNLVDRGREMFSAVLFKEDFMEVKRSVKKVLDEQPLKHELKKPSIAARLVKALERCNKELLALKRKCDGCVVLESADPFTGLVESLYTVMDQFLEEEEDSELRKQVLDFYFEISHYLLIYEKLDKNYVIYCEMTQDQRFMLKLFCVNPSNNLKDAMSKGRTSILFSATFLPIQYYKKLLGGESEDYETYAKSTFDSNKRGLFIAKDVTSKFSRRNDVEYHKIASYIFEAVNAKPGNYMVFFPSHAFLANVLKHYQDSFWDEKDTELIVQEEFMTEEMREDFLSRFDVSKDKTSIIAKEELVQYKPIKSLIGFCVLGGIFSEGIDLKNDSLIGVIIVGTGLPMVCNEREILKDYFDDESSSGFDYAYRYPGMNKVLQAAGRVIRTSEDVGTVTLLDDRFMQAGNRRLFPREWDNYVNVSGATFADELELFWEGHR